MRVEFIFASSCIVAAVLACSAPAMAQTAIAKFHVHFSGAIDCQQPIAAANIPISGDGTGVLNSDGSASADVTETAFVFSNTIHFDGRIGARPQPAPAGTAMVRVQGKNSLRLIWNLPNNALVVSIVTRGQSCSASFAANLFRESASTPCLTARPSIIAAVRAPPAPRARCIDA